MTNDYAESPLKNPYRNTIININVVIHAPIIPNLSQPLKSRNLILSSAIIYLRLKILTIAFAWLKADTPVLFPKVFNGNFLPASVNCIFPISLTFYFTGVFFKILFILFNSVFSLLINVIFITSVFWYVLFFYVIVSLRLYLYLNLSFPLLYLLRIYFFLQ